MGKFSSNSIKKYIKFGEQMGLTLQNDYEVFYHLAVSIGGFPHPFNGKHQQKHPVYHNAG